jgi:prefoldin alpha subunit
VSEGTGPQAIDEQKLQQDYAMLENAKAQLEGLLRQQQLIQLAVDEHVRARETLKELAKGTPGDEVLMPLGANSYVPARISENGSVIMGMGAGVSIQKTKEEAEAFLDTKIDELSRAFKTVTERAQQMESAIQELTEKMQSQYGTPA